MGDVKGKEEELMTGFNLPPCRPLYLHSGSNSSTLRQTNKKKQRRGGGGGGDPDVPISGSANRLHFFTVPHYTATKSEAAAAEVPQRTQLEAPSVSCFPFKTMWTRVTRVPGDRGREGEEEGVALAKTFRRCV